jgi:hypothetical protein
MKIGIDYFGVCNTPDAYYYLDQLKSQGHELYLVAFIFDREQAVAVSKFMSDDHKDLFTKEIYVNNPLAVSRFCDIWAIDLMIDSDINIIWSIPIANTIHFRCNDYLGLYPHPKAMFTAYSWEEAMEIISKSVPLNLKPIPDIYVSGMIHHLS